MRVFPLLDSMVTDRRTDRPTKRGVESRSTRLIMKLRVYITPIQEHSIFDYDGDNGLNLLILVSITFPENFIVLNELNQKAYWV